MTIIKGYLIDPTDRAEPVKIAPLTLDDEGEIPLKTLYALLDCRMVEIVSMINGDVMFVDEDGLLKNGDLPAFSLTGLITQPYIVGKALIVGCGGHGETKPTTMKPMDFADGVLQLGVIKQRVANG